MTAVLIATFAGIAGGLDLFLTIALLSLGVQLLGIGLPGTAEDLGTVWIFAAAAVLYAVEAYLERSPGPSLMWRWAGLAIRPAGAAALAALLSDSPDLGSSLPIILAAVVLALLVQALRSGWAFLGTLGETRPTVAMSLALEDTCVVALVVAVALALPAVAVVVTPLIVLGLLKGPRLLAAFAVSVGLARGAIRAGLNRRGWRSPARFPDWMKQQLAPTAIVTGGRLRASPVACVGHPEVPSVCRGWLVVRGREPRFVRPTRRGFDAVALMPGAETDVAAGPFWSTVRVATSDLRTVMLVVPVDGPKPHELMQELT